MMPSNFVSEDIEAVVAALLGAIDVDAGATDEQLAVLQAFATHLWKRPDIKLPSVAPSGPHDIAARLIDDKSRLWFCELMMILELCRHPQSVTQVEKAEEFATALNVSNIALETTRTALERGSAVVAGDLERLYGEILPEISERSLRDRYLRLETPDPALSEQLRTLEDLPIGTLGHAYIAFYDNYGFTMPGDDPHLPAHYVNHDMNHVITGYAPTAAGEIARSGFLMAANASRHNWLEFLLTMSIHESGVLNHGEIRSKFATLSRPGVADLLGEGIDRGHQCPIDLSQVDHLAIADESLESIRKRFNIVPLADPEGTNAI